MPFITIGRKAKDKRDLAAANTSGGTVTIRSKNKIANPLSPGETLGRGSQVIVRQTPSLNVEKPTVIPGKTHIKISRGTRESYTPGDFQGKVHDRPTTPALGKSMGENPGKTKLRMNAQASGQTTYKTPSGKSEYAGRTETKPTVSTTLTKDPDQVRMGKTSITMKKDVSVIPVASSRKEKNAGKGKSGIAIQRMSGENRKGNPQNYLSLNKVNKAGQKKSLLKIKTYTPGSRGRTGSVGIFRKKGF